MDEMLRSALELREQGFAVHWLHQRSKVPILEGWAKAPVLSPAELQQTYQPGYNVGFRPGRFSVVDGREIAVLDIDVRGGTKYAAEAYAAANSLVETFLPNVISGSGVGRHQLLGFPIGAAPDKAATTLRESDVWLCDGKRCIPRTKGARPAWQVELLSTGKNVVLPPSIHPDTGSPYIWIERQDHENH